MDGPREIRRVLDEVRRPPPGPVAPPGFVNVLVKVPPGIRAGMTFHIELPASASVPGRFQVVCPPGCFHPSSFVAQVPANPARVGVGAVGRSPPTITGLRRQISLARNVSVEIRDVRGDPRRLRDVPRLGDEPEPESESFRAEIAQLTNSAAYGGTAVGTAAVISRSKAADDSW
jgi:hypothetical protein